MNATRRRLALYVPAVLAIGGLGWAATVKPAPADLMTLLSGADVQLRFAARIPAVGPDGADAPPARAEMIATAEGFLADAERQRPGLAVTAEFQGFACMLRGDHAGAAAAYRRARACSDCTDEQRDVLVFNEARMLAKAGQGQQALDLYLAHGPALDARYGPQRRFEEAEVLRLLGRTGEARQRLDAIVAADTATADDCVRAGAGYALLGEAGLAEAVLTQAAADQPFANFHLAKLKLQQGAVDSCLDLLAVAAKALPTEVKQALREDAQAWSAVAADARYQEIAGTNPAAPAR